MKRLSTLFPPPVENWPNLTPLPVLALTALVQLLLVTQELSRPHLERIQ